MPGDWVVQPESWTGVSEPVDNGLALNTNEFAGAPLTVNNFSIGGVDQERYREHESSTTTVTVRGVVHMYLSVLAGNPIDRIFTNSWIMESVLRIAVNDIDPVDPANITPTANFSLRGTATANQDFLWEERLFWGNIDYTNWLNTSGIREQWHMSIPVHVKVGRKLRPLEGLVIWFAWLNMLDPIFEAPSPQVTMNYVPRLRTFVR